MSSLQVRDKAKITWGKETWVQVEAESTGRKIGAPSNECRGLHLGPHSRLCSLTCLPTLLPAPLASVQPALPTSGPEVHDDLPGTHRSLPISLDLAAAAAVSHTTEASQLPHFLVFLIAVFVFLEIQSLYVAMAGLELAA